jgi:peptidoglycan L-alanyl-D-glutamate endopeptidase CwlK
MQTFDPRTEKNIATLHPKAQEKARAFMALAVPAMAAHGLEVRIISGNRTYAEQNALYAQGRSKPGPKVTNAQGGYSNHNFGVAWDIGLFNGSHYLDESPYYRECGRLGKSLGLAWGGDWKSIQDEPHFEVPTGLTLAQMRARVAAGKSVL